MDRLIVTPREAARMLCISLESMYQLLNEGIVKAYIYKGGWKVPVKSLEAYINTQIERRNE